MTEISQVENVWKSSQYKQTAIMIRKISSTNFSSIKKANTVTINQYKFCEISMEYVYIIQTNFQQWLETLQLQINIKWGKQILIQFSD